MCLIHYFQYYQIILLTFLIYYKNNKAKGMIYLMF